MKSIESYNRRANLAELESYCHLSKKDGFMEVTEWHNGEGYDIVLHNGMFQQNFTLTHGELQLLQVLTNYRGVE